MKPPIWFSLILAIQELSCLLLFLSLYFYAKYTNLKNIVRYHSIGLTRSKPGTFDPQGLPCLTRVLPTCPTCPTLFHSPGIQSLDLWHKTPKRPRDSFFQVRATNKMNENIWHPNLHKILKRCWEGLSGPVTVWTWKIGLAPKTPLIV
jgi:hypothetical protein